MIHPWHDITPGELLPSEFLSVIEIPFGSSVKYELDKPSGLIASTASSTRQFTILPTMGLSRRPSPKMTTRWTCWSFARNRLCHSP